MWQLMEDLLSQPEKFFKNHAKDKPAKAVKYLMFWAMLPAFILIVLEGFLGVKVGAWLNLSTWLAPLALGGTTMTGLSLAIARGFFTWLGTCIGVFVTAVVAHAVIRVFDGKGHFGRTLNSIAYGASPAYAFGWLPLFGVIFALYSIILQVVAIRETHNLDFATSAVTMLGILFAMAVVGAWAPLLASIFQSAYHPEIVFNTIKMTAVQLAM
jgi:hypothetical protein